MAGSLEQRGKNRWRLVVSCGMDANGKQVKKTKTVTATSRREAEKELAKLVAEIEKGLFVEPSRLTFADFVERWLRDYAETSLAPKTLFRYKQLLSSRILPAMGHLKLEQIKPLHLMEFYSNLQEDGIRADGKTGGLSEKTILYHHRVISSILQDAVEWQVLPANPASRVKPPKAPRKQAASYDEEQTAALLEAAAREPLKYRVMIVLEVATGLRRGELMGLEWKDVNFERGTIEVRQTSQYLPDQGVFTKEPKTETSKRMIAVPSSVMALLKEYRTHQLEERLKAGDLWKGSDRLFTTWDGQPMHPDTISKWFPKFLKRHWLPPLPFHGLRHTSTTLLIAQGVNVKNISTRLGHASISTTMDIYGHALKSADREAADKLDHLFSGNVKQKKGQG
ncbi:integrase [Clostridiales bacterium PH28_bin88]|nr:integrase [Clostridiales bacterium PH28_bin88]